MALSPAKSNVWVDRAFTGANLGMVLAISYLSVKVFFLFLEPGSLQSPPTLYGQATSTSPKQSLNAMAAVDPSAIPLWNLFGREGETKVAVTAQQDVDAPKTSLQLELQGVFVAVKEENSTAIIAERMREAKLYRIGDKLPGNATLAGVFPDRVLLNTMGRTEALYFPDLSQGGGFSGASGPRGPSGPGGFSPVSNARGGGMGSTMGRGGMGSVAPGGGQPNFGMGGGMPPPDDIANAIKNELGGNPQQALSEMGLQMNGGNGYKVSNASNPMLSAIGARPGSIIKAINGRQLGNPEADFAAIEELAGAEEFSVTVEDEKGRTFTSSMPKQF